MWSSSRKGQKCAVTRVGRTSDGEIQGLDAGISSGYSLITSRNLIGKSLTLPTGAAHWEELFNSISDDATKIATKAESEEEMKSKSHVKPAALRRNSIVETLILSGRYKGIWIRARILRGLKNKMDLEVQFPKKWMVAEKALAVPKRFIRAVTDHQTYTVPIEFTVDGTMLYVSCDDRSTVKDLKEIIFRERKFPLNQIYFICDGNWLINSDAIPNGRIFCIIHRGGQLTNHLIELASTLKQKRKSVSLSSESWEISSPMGRSLNSLNVSHRTRRKSSNNNSPYLTRKSSNLLQSLTEKSFSQSSSREGRLGSPITPLSDSEPSQRADKLMPFSLGVGTRSREILGSV